MKLHGVSWCEISQPWDIKSSPIETPDQINRKPVGLTPMSQDLLNMSAQDINRSEKFQFHITTQFS